MESAPQLSKPAFQAILWAANILGAATDVGWQGPGPKRVSKAASCKRGDLRRAPGPARLE